MKILVLNAGSSSLKYQLFDMENESVIAKGLAERISMTGSTLKQEASGKEYKISRPMPTHTEAMEFVLAALLNKESG
ncbi:MAG TPA: acetate kinase, partial [Clostridia bacterium]|nr:acetate kinase [Clostridia bacterium]